MQLSATAYNRILIASSLLDRYAVLSIDGSITVRAVLSGEFFNDGKRETPYR